MADFSIPLTVPDNKTTELVDALRWKFFHASMTPEDYAQITPAQLRARLKEQNENFLKAAFIEHKRWLASQAASNDSIDIT